MSSQRNLTKQTYLLKLVLCVSYNNYNNALFTSVNT